MKKLTAMEDCHPNIVRTGTAFLPCLPLPSRLQDSALPCGPPHQVMLIAVLETKRHLCLLQVPGKTPPFLALPLRFCQRLTPLPVGVVDRLRQSGAKEMINPVCCTYMSSL